MSNINPEQFPGFPGKINAACYYLQQEYKPDVSLPLYTELFSELMELLGKHPYYEQLLKGLKLRPYLSLNGLGLYTVYKIRNTFAHGALRFPEPEDWSGITSVDAMIIQVSSRIVLLSIQMLLLSFYKKDSFTIWCPLEYWAQNDDADENWESEDIDAELFLRQVHLTCFRGGHQLMLSI